MPHKHIVPLMVGYKKDYIPMMDESTMREKSNSHNEQNSPESHDRPDKTSQRILAAGATLSMVLLSLGVVVWSLGNLRLSLKLKK